MLHKMKDIVGYEVQAVNNPVGTVTDLYFDDNKLEFRYIVINATISLETKRFLVSPIAIGGIDEKKRLITVSLTLQKVLKSPEFDTDLPISRQKEMALRRYYEWPVYWGQTSFMDTREVKNLDEGWIESTAEQEDSGPENQVEEYTEDEETYPDSVLLSMPEETDEEEIADMEFARREENVSFSGQLRSARALIGYHIKTNTEKIGRLHDFIINDDNWSIRYFVIDTQEHPGGKQVLLTLHWLQSVRWDTSEIRISLSGDDLLNAPTYDPETPLSRDYEQLIYRYYDSLKR